uniref:Uncharacterized protein n=1 Tax=Trichobilharzia regenti TaxID=157069 RepID=A0AA85J4Y0_TRIRE|nr:unnamed protein product [Trichobilharzia regenti]
MKFSAFVTPKVSANTVLDWRDYTVFACLEGTMSAECSTSSSLKESPLHTKISRYLFYFIWMLVDTLFFVLGTVCMILVVSNSETITDYFAGHHNTPTILIAIGIAATIILVLFRGFKYENVVDHLLIVIGYLLISFGFAGAFLRKHTLHDSLHDSIFSVYESLRNTIHFHDDKSNAIIKILRETHHSMILSRASSTHTAHKSQTKQRGSASFFVWFLVDLIIMILVTVGAVILINKDAIFRFFERHGYMQYILLSITGVLLMLIIFVRKIRSYYLATRIVLEIVVLLCNGLKNEISCFAMVVLTVLFLIIIMFTCSDIVRNDSKWIQILLILVILAKN